MTLNDTFCWKKSRTDADIIRNMEKRTVYQREWLTCSRYARSDTWGKTETRGSHWFVYWIRIDFPWMAVPRLTCSTENTSLSAWNAHQRILKGRV